MNDLNYHHLQYFRAVAHEGNLTRAAARMNLSQSALSTQIRLLEDRLGYPLFDRVGRRLELTEVGRIALDHADRIFGTGEELLEVLKGRGRAGAPLRVGAASTLSRNFQLRFLQPVLGAGDLDLQLASGLTESLLDQLSDLALDVVLTTEPPARARERGFVAHPISREGVAIHGLAPLKSYPSLAALLSDAPLILPTETAIRRAFDNLVARLGLRPRIAAEVDDMAMVRLLVREGTGLAIAPSIVFRDEIAAGLIAVSPLDLGIEEQFFAVTVQRTFPHPRLAELIPVQPG
ncbi:MAG: LysR family transcriptional regulator [Sulfitobacter sp.]|nr:LysR family transcriptional regulator [Sulfitobacter sp.]